MFNSLSDKLQTVFRRLRGEGTVSDKVLDEALKEIRLALLEADVNYKVVKEFVAAIRTRARGAEVMKSLTPGQQVVKVVHDELVSLLAGDGVPKLKFRSSPPSVFLMVGLQGSGKTTTTGKLGLRLKATGRHPLLVPCDVYRPAAIDQLERVGEQAGVAVFDAGGEREPVAIAIAARRHAAQLGHDLVIIDSAGRLHIDDDMMAELERLKSELSPTEILLVADAMTGQDAVRSATEFDRRLSLTGVVLSKLDGDTRGGAALSIRAVTGKPLRFIGVGEKLDALEEFEPERLASRILGMGDVMSLVEKAQQAFSLEEAEDLERRLRKNSFTLEDFRLQLKQIQKMGPLDQVLQMVPGFSRIAGSRDVSVDDKQIARLEAIINSMTRTERLDHTIINGSRRRRIARGSGTSVQEVNRLLRQYAEMRKGMKKLLGGRGLRGLLGA